MCKDVMEEWNQARKEGQACLAHRHHTSLFLQWAMVTKQCKNRPWLVMAALLRRKQGIMKTMMSCIARNNTCYFYPTTRKERARLELRTALHPTRNKCHSQQGTMANPRHGCRKCLHWIETMKVYLQKSSRNLKGPLKKSCELLSKEGQRGKVAMIH